MNGNTTLPSRPSRRRGQPHGDPAKLTPGQRRTLEFIWDRVLRTGDAPTVREIASDAEISRMPAWRRLQSLERQQLITIERDTWRGIRVLVWPPKGWTRPARSDAA